MSSTPPLQSTRVPAPRAARWFLAPYVVGAVLLVIVPAAMNAAYAFTNHTGLAGGDFTGFANVRRMLADPLFQASLRATLVHAAIAVPLRLAIATTFGLLLAAPRRGGRLYRTAVYLPTIVPDVALALLFLWILNPLFGPLNRILGAFGLHEPAWLTNPWTARFGIVIMLAFPIGEAFLVVLAARRSISPTLYDAASVDGASPWQRLRYITLPVMAPLLVLLAIRDVILTLQVNFVPGYVLTDGGPGHATLYLPLYIYDQAFEFAGFGYAALLSIVLMVITAVLIAAVILLARRWNLLGSADD